MIRCNLVRSDTDSPGGAIRGGAGLLCGLLRCGRCGRKVRVRYWGRAGSFARYLCAGSFEAGGAYCLGFAGRAVDSRFAEELLRALSPLGVRASVEAAARVGVEDEGRKRALERQLEYEARRAFEQYDEVDPRRRLVADELERRWNEKLCELESARAAVAELEQRRPIELKKKIVRTVVEVVVNEEPEGRESASARGRGGCGGRWWRAGPRARAARGGGSSRKNAGSGELAVETGRLALTLPLSR